MAEADSPTKGGKAKEKGGKARGGGSVLPDVGDWGYVSPEAISMEYLETAANCVSLV